MNTNTEKTFRGEHIWRQMYKWLQRRYPFSQRFIWWKESGAGLFWYCSYCGKYHTFLTSRFSPEEGMMLGRYKYLKDVYAVCEKGWEYLDVILQYLKIWGIPPSDKDN